MKIRSRKLTNKVTKSSFKIKGLIILFILFLGAKVFLTIQVSANSEKIVNLEAKVDNLKNSNQLLKENLATVSSLTNLREDAESLGYSNIDNMLYIKTEDVFAKAN